MVGHQMGLPGRLLTRYGCLNILKSWAIFKVVAGGRTSNLDHVPPKGIGTSAQSLTTTFFTIVTERTGWIFRLCPRRSLTVATLCCGDPPGKPRAK